MRHLVVRVALVLGLVVGSGTVHAAPQTFPAGSLIIPMDLSYQDTGLLQSYGLLFQLLRQNVPVAWVIDPMKTWHAAPCDTVGDLCPWACDEAGSAPCPYPTSSPDFTVAATVVWSDEGTAAGTAIDDHPYRGGPFVIDAADHDAALAIIDAWNDPAQWAANPWAQRAIAEVVTVHETAADFTGTVSRQLLAAPTIAVFSDGNEDIATGYLRAAGIKQSTGGEFPEDKCGMMGVVCGPGTVNPDMLTVPSVAGDMGTCDGQNYDHENGALFNADGLPQYCQIMSMHWDVNDRETVQCDGGNCPATQAGCTGQTITYHGHEVVAEVRAFLAYPVHFFAECQAVNAYENTVPNPAWPFLDDAGRDGHFLTPEGTPPTCGTCSDIQTDFVCVAGECEPSDVKEKGAGFLIATSPSPYQVLHPEVPYNQLDGEFEPVGGSEPAYNLSTYLGTMYKNDREVTFITGPNGPGDQDVWMSGFLDGECDIIDPIGIVQPGIAHGPPVCAGGKVSYLGGHRFELVTPVSGETKTQGARLFLNALFEADCVTSAGQPELELSLTPMVVGAESFPWDADLDAGFQNFAASAALDAELRAVVGAGIELVDAAGGAVAGDTATWTVGSIGGVPVRPDDPAAGGTRTSTMRFDAAGDYDVTVELDYTVGVTRVAAASRTFTVHVAIDSDGDGVPDDLDPFPDDPDRCGDADGDGCDDCADPETCDPAVDGDPDGGCCDTGGGPAGPAALGGLIVLGFLGLRRRRT